jgi:protein tolA
MGAGDGGKTGSAYAGIVYSSIKPYFRGDNRFIGKVCDIKMEISSDGTILSYEKKSGPNDLCAAALNAISQAKKMRRAPTPEEYQMFKSFTLGFDPRKVR